MMNECACGSGATYAACCQPYIEGVKPAETAEVLLRARYTAHAVAAIDYIVNTTHADSRAEVDVEATRRWAERSEWLGLEVRATERGTAADDVGTIEFIANYRDAQGRRQAHHELAEFARQDGQWFFKDAVAPSTEPVRRSVPKVGRNAPCPCGSGTKYKKCCGAAA
ncbi:MAG: YchJ family protein [Pseudomonadota bacterium]